MKHLPGRHAGGEKCPSEKKVHTRRQGRISAAFETMEPAAKAFFLLGVGLIITLLFVLVLFCRNALWLHLYLEETLATIFCSILIVMGAGFLLDLSLREAKSKEKK